MLTADLVSARRRGAELVLTPLRDEQRGSAQQIARAILRITSEHVGRTRDDIESALSEVDVGPREHRLRDGLAKLTLDRCVFDAGDEIGAEALRREVFERASQVRAALREGQRFDRGDILRSVAAERGTPVDVIDRNLFADLRGAHVLLSFETLSPERLVDEYERAQAQAVLLRAVRVQVDVRCASAPASRALFRRLRFLRLLHTITATEQGYRVAIDGPFSLFESITKYGLSLAMLLPALEGCEAWRLEADVRWGKERIPLVFRASGRRASRDASERGASSASERGASSAMGAVEPELVPEVEALRASFGQLGTDWTVRPSADILELPGVGLCVPDLLFERARAVGSRGGARRRSRESTDRVYLEVMGYWSRAAVWRRVELVRAGLVSRVLFAVGAHLRVSEEVLDGDLPGALYVYKRTMSARAIAERLERLVRGSP